MSDFNKAASVAYGSIFSIEMDALRLRCIECTDNECYGHWSEIIPEDTEVGKFMSCILYYAYSVTVNIKCKYFYTPRGLNIMGGRLISCYWVKCLGFSYMILHIISS